MQRILVIGNGGTGKSTLSAELSERLGIPVYHLDQIAWGPRWTRVSEQDYAARLNEILAAESWIVDGWSSQSSMQQRLDAADTIIFLDYAIWLAYYGATKRFFQYYSKRNPYDPPETTRGEVLMLTYRAMWRVYRNYVPELRSMLEKLKSKSIIHARSRAELQRKLNAAFEEKRIVNE